MQHLQFDSEKDFAPTTPLRDWSYHDLRDAVRTTQEKAHAAYWDSTRFEGDAKIAAELEQKAWERNTRQIEAEITHRNEAQQAMDAKRKKRNGSHAESTGYRGGSRYWPTDTARGGRY